MLTVSIDEAKKQLSSLVDRAAKGDPFVIAKAGKPLVKVSAVEQRLGFLAGEIDVPDDFNRMFGRAIEVLFRAGAKLLQGSPALDR